ncbi:nitroreductase family protein, partial [Myxococcota bacterium]|nr:nitroreductase family protein [Myxococcota bacterium]
MDLDLAMRTTASIRAFRPEPVPDEMLARILERARFAGSGGNRQGWRVLVVKDAAIRRRICELYVPIFAEYVDGLRRGQVSYSPDWTPGEDPPQPVANEFADQLDRVPALLVVLAELGTLAITDRDLARPSIVGGASVYPFVQNILLAARGEGLGGVLTTMLCRKEPEIAALLHVPPS